MLSTRLTGASRASKRRMSKGKVTFFTLKRSKKRKKATITIVHENYNEISQF